MAYVASLLYNCAITVNSHIEDVEQLIAKSQINNSQKQNQACQISFLVAGLSLLLQDGEAG